MTAVGGTAAYADSRNSLFAATNQLREHLFLQLGVPELRAHASDFIGMSEIQRLLDELERVAPQSVRQVLPKPSSLGTLTEVLRRLVDPVLLSAPDIRRFVRRLVQTELPQLAVISHAELLPEIALETVATATIPNL